jgi:hypothetical protein
MDDQWASPTGVGTHQAASYHAARAGRHFRILSGIPLVITANF